VHAWCSEHLSECTPHYPQKNAYAPVHMRLCKSAETSSTWKVFRTYLESCASIVQAVVCRPPSCCRRNRLPDAVRSRNPSKSTLAQAQDAVTAAVSHKHHSIICIGAGLIQFVYGSHSKRGHGAHPSKNSILAMLSRESQMCRSYFEYKIYMIGSRRSVLPTHQYPQNPKV